ncbi:hypothetical protein [Pendulispora albinea]|uniref:Lipoprotein n=1 Tax=Pendulispora albinea TaxID=2741071 RepID=A0ABZ2MAD2_9BACT
MRLRHASWFGLYALVACSSQDAGDAKVHRSPSVGSDAGSEGDSGSGADAGPETDAGTPDSGQPDAGPPGRLTPSNLPADICDSPGTKDLIVPGDPLGTCDIIVAQGNGFPDICVYKFDTVVIGAVMGFSERRAVAIVATNTLTVTNAGGIDVSARDVFFNGSGAPDPRGAGFSGGGAGHVTRGGGSGGAAYASSGPQLSAGARGGNGSSASGRPPVDGGAGGGAVQLVSCGRLDIHGPIESNGTYGRSTASNGTGGAGGGSGGMILLEAAQIFMQGASLRALGGNGGSGADYRPGSDLGRGGKGGTGSSLPEAGGGSGPFYGPGGGGGSIGRIVINLPQGVPPPVVNADPPAVFGVVATH